MAINPLKILTYLTASKDAKFEESVNIVGAGTALTVTNTASIGELNVVGNATVNGDLTVKGQFTYIESTVVTVGDTNLNLGTGSNDLAVLDGGGLDLGTQTTNSAPVEWRYDNANTSWTSNVDVNLKTDTEQYKIAGAEVLTKTGTVLEVGAGVNTVMVANGNELAVSGTLQLSGASDFTYITNVTRNVGGLYDVDYAIHELDTAISGVALSAGGDLTTLKNNYNKLRTVITGTFTSGQAIITLTTYDTGEFAVGQIDNIALDILVDSGSTGRYTNDLVAMELYTSGSDLKVQIDAPATPSGKYRLIAVNERDGGLG